MLHFYERKPTNNGQHIADSSKVVKEFARSAAGIQRPRPNQLRTPAALKRTVRYLLTDVLCDSRKPFNVAYDYIFDRLRAVRQEIVMQNFNYSLTIELLEPIIMFLAYSLYRLVSLFDLSQNFKFVIDSLLFCVFRLVEEPIDRFDPKICRQHLQECLKKVLTCYDNLDEAEKKVELLNRETIESLYLLFNLGNGETLSRAVKLSIR